MIVVSHLPPTNSAQLKAAGAADYVEKSSLEDDKGAAVFLGTIKRVLRESQGRNEVETHRTAGCPAMTVSQVIRTQPFGLKSS